MHIIEKRWVDLHAGYLAVQSLEARLQTEWGRAIQVAQRRSDRTARSGRNRTRKTLGITLIAFIFLCALLWVGFYYLPDRRGQLLVYVCLLSIAVSLLGAAYMFFRGIAVTQTHTLPSMDLIEPWWKSLRPRSYPARTKGDRAEIDFLRSLSFLNDEYIAVWGLLTSAKRTSDTDVLLLGPTGIWVFEVKYWNGAISKHDEVWYAEHRIRGRKAQEKSPDQQWVDQKEEISKTIERRLPGKPWLAELIKGGVVFSHQNVTFGQIENHQAAYGKPASWHKRIREAKPDKDFSIEDQLQLLDALILDANLHEKEKLEIVSAREEANQRYENAATDLRKYIAERLR